MEQLSTLSRSEHDDDDSNCAFIAGENGERRYCGARRRPGSPYCADHHVLCHVRCGTPEEIKRLREVEVLANAVGGRRTRHASGPSSRFLRRLEHIAGAFS